MKTQSTAVVPLALGVLLLSNCAYAQHHKVHTPTIDSYEVKYRNDQSPSVLFPPEATDNSGGSPRLGLHTVGYPNVLGFFKRVEVGATMKGSTSSMEFKWFQQIQGTIEQRVGGIYTTQNYPNWAWDSESSDGSYNPDVTTTHTINKKLYLYDEPGLGLGNHTTDPNDYAHYDTQFRNAIKVRKSDGSFRDTHAPNGSPWFDNWHRLLRVRATNSQGYPWQVLDNS